MEEYGLALKKLRQHFALTQRELGERVGISNHAISKWEHGVNQPDISSLRAICEVFGITTEDFFRIAAGEEVSDVLNRTENSPIESEMAGADTRSPQNTEVLSSAETPPPTPTFTARKLVLAILCGVLAVATAVSVAFAVAFGFTKNGLPNNTHSSATESGDLGGNTSDTATDTGDSSGSSDDTGDSSDTSDVPPQRVIGHLDYYVDGRYFGAHDIMEGEEVTPPYVEKTGYVFLGWYTEQTGGEYFDFETFDFENMDKSYWLYARFRPAKYYVVFMDGYGSGTYTTSVEYQESWTFPDAIFERGGYRLDGWETKNGVIYKCGADGANLTDTDGVTIQLTAVWTWTNPDAVHVKFINPDGEIAAAEQAQSVGVPFVLPAPTATKQGYKFGGYTYKNKTYQPGDTFIINADEVSDGEFVIGWWWQSISYTIHYQMTYQGRDYVVTQDYFYSEWNTFAPKQAFNAVVANFDKVLGWVIDGKSYKPGAAVPEFMKLDGAQYRATAILNVSADYTLHFVSDKHENPTIDVTANSNSPAVLPECPFTHEDYYFIGWEWNGRTYRPGDVFPYIDGTTEYTFTAVWMGKPHGLELTSSKHVGQAFVIHVEYGYEFPFTDMLQLCKNHGWDLTGLTLSGIMVNGNFISADEWDYYPCIQGKEGEVLTVEILWKN